MTFQKTETSKTNFDCEALGNQALLTVSLRISEIRRAVLVKC